ncbi:MAG: hypothetical protein ACOYBY_00840 [Dermatophilaceae bacterium]
MTTADPSDPLASRARPYAERDATLLPPFVVPLTVLLAGLVALGAGVGYAASVIVFGLGALVLAWGWARLLDAPTPRGVRAVLVVGALLVGGALALTDGPQRLRWLPVAVAVGIIGGFLQQLLRDDGRDRLTFGVSVTASGLATMASGASIAPLATHALGPNLVHVAMGALAAGALAGLSSRWPRVGALAVLVVLVAGAVAGGLIAAVVGMRILGAVGLGMFVASVSYSVRLVLGALPDRDPLSAQAASAAASVLLPGVIVLAMAALAGV